MSNSHRTHISHRPEATALLAVAFLVFGVAAAFAQVSFHENTVDSQYGINLFANPIDLDEDGTITYATWVQGVIFHPTSVAENGDDDIWAGVVPRLAAAPNPFARVTSVVLTLPSPSDVRTTVHDLAGRVVKEITDLHLDAGIHTFEWDGTNREGLPVATGVYFCRVTSEHGNASGTMVLLHRRERPGTL